MLKINDAGVVSRPLRKDAERNRARVLDAARTLFAESGLNAPLDEIARRAGVSAGTVYHRFGDRDHLIDEALLPLVVESVEHARMSLSDPDPWHGLVTHLFALAKWQSEDRAFTDICVLSLPDDFAIEAAKREGHSLTEKLVSRAQRSGQLRADVTLGDIGLLVSGTVKATEPIRSEQPDAWRRHLQIVIDGLRVEAASALPGTPPAPADVAAAMQR